MGCAPSTQSFQVNENETRLIQEIDRLRNKEQSQQSPPQVQPVALAFSPAPSQAAPQKNKNLPKVGDPVLAMWESTPWQYFTATIVSFNSKALKYNINWDDQDPTGRVIDYYNLALDRVPEPDEIATGSTVLFPQGKYCGQAGVRLGGLRYHQGRITRVHNGDRGQKLYDGIHTKGESDNKWVTYQGYSLYFRGVEISQLRISPNVLDILSAQDPEPASSQQANTVDGGIRPCDIFISYTKANSPQAIKNRELASSDAPPSYDEAMLSSICDPRDIRYQLEGCGAKVNGDKQAADSLIQTVQQINTAKVFVACLSDEYVQDEICRQEFQYAKKTVKKPVIPIVVGSGSFDWMMTVVGLLIAGEVYIHFSSKDVQELKMTELLKAVKKSVPAVRVPDGMGSAQEIQTTEATPAARTLGPADVFISYCWVNSEDAHKAKHVKEFIGSSFADPRKVHAGLAANDKFSIWIDTQRLRTTNQNDESLGMFAQIAEGLGKAKVVLAFVSKQYANSENCRMEIQFALKSLKKPVVPVIVGADDDWQNTVVGLLVAGQENRPINLQDVSSEDVLQQKVQEIQSSILPLLGLKEETRSYRAPVIGDHVISHHIKWAYFPASIVSFDRETMSYTVDWDDGDPTGKVQSYKDLAIDEIPSEDQVGVDSIVFFPQGSYGATAGNNIGGMRFHQGIITRVYKDSSGIWRYDGHHTKGETDGKWVTYKDYDYDFNGIPLEHLRIAPNAMDALMACQQAFS
ncbi:hypothetical protein OS493_034322 [Desmophyllum pertusum]|uniref:TIR domain-containing protein n=1 Tax=Desmophyllum pertusum TaxID=174260 RepID=A0A9W9YJ05_9CNID|nr:hypothetical protein OS493_034322 [Desmophyllum pertusum]